MESYEHNAEELYAAGTRLFSQGISGPDYDFGPLKELLAWRDRVNAEG